MQRVLAATATIDKNLFSPAENFDNVGSLLAVIVNNGMVLAGILAFIMIIIGGFGIIMGAGAGDPKRTQSGQKTLTAAVAGLLIVVFAMWIVQLLKLILGVDPLNPWGN